MIIQKILKDIVVSVADAGLRGEAYNLINTIARNVAIVIGIWNGRKLKVSWIAVIVSIVIERALVGPLMTVILFVSNGFKSTNEANGVVVFSFVPLTGFLISKAMRKSYKEIWDTMMVVPLLMFAGARIACTVAGCCYGYSCDWGIYNVSKGEYLFPIQLVESFVAILIFVIVIWRERKNRYISDGRNVPLILILYGIARFFLEFLHDNQKNGLGLALTQFHCMLMILVGILTLNIIKRSEKQIAESPIEEN